MFTPNSLIIRYGGACLMLLTLLLSQSSARTEEAPPYAAYFNPAKGFKPAQANFQLIFLQMAGSFEYFGTPEPYLRHIIAEHARIDAKYRKIRGTEATSRPAYFTDDYLEKLTKKWNQLAPILTLESLTRQSGANMRHAIMGSWNMSVAELASLEKNLSEIEKGAYRNLLGKSYFTKADFPALEAFYGDTFEKLTEDGKGQISRRTWMGRLTPEKRSAVTENNKGGTMLLALLGEHQKKSLSYLEDRTQPKADAETLQELIMSRLSLDKDQEVPADLQDMERDAFRYSYQIRAGIRKRIDHVRRQAKEPGQADAIENVLWAMVGELAVLAQSEYKAALFDDMLELKKRAN